MRLEGLKDTVQEDPQGADERPRLPGCINSHGQEGKGEHVKKTRGRPYEDSNFSRRGWKTFVKYREELRYIGRVARPCNQVDGHSGS